MGLLSTLFESVAVTATAGSVVFIGPTHSVTEDLLTDALQKNEVKASDEQLALLKSGPVYVTSNGIVPVGNVRPFRLSDNGHASDLLYLVSFKMPDEYLKLTAQTAVKTKGVLVLRGLKNNSVADTIAAAKPLLDEGALVEIDPVPSGIYKHNFHLKAPIVVSTQINSAGGYGCETDAPKSCAPAVAVGGFANVPFKGYSVKNTWLQLMPSQNGKTDADVHQYNVMKIRAQGLTE